MKFKSLLIASLLVVFSQSLSAQEQRKFCVTDEKYHQMLQEDPQFAKNRADLEAFTQKWVAEHANDQTQKVNGSTKKIIPVVFHVLHNYGGENISDAQIRDAVRIWSEDCQKLNPDINTVVPSFTSITGNLEVEFRLATIDPLGNCTNGIDRIPTMKTYLAEDATGAKLNPWPNDKYLNVWVCASIGASHPMAAAYAQFPGGNGLTDGIMTLNNYVGSIGTSSANNSRTLTHELGHCFNLYHIWGNTAVGTVCGDDGVSDTPFTKGHTSCPLNDAVCAPPTIENLQNYMEYAYCDRMFTIGQVNRMLACLTSGTSGRNNLWQTANNIATGTADPYDYDNKPLCTPVADFTSTRQLVCVGDIIRFLDYSSGGKATSWNWTFPGATPVSSTTDSMPYVQYTAVGSYSVTLTSTNATGSSTPVTKTAFIQVIDPTPQPLPAVEGFEDATFPPAGAIITNPDNSNTWKRSTTAHFTGAGCMTIANSGYKAGQVDEYITPAYDFTDRYPTLNFDRAYALLNPDQTRLDVLKIYYSLNCGASWTLRTSRSGATLTTTTPKNSGWYPTDTSQWRADSVPGLYNLLKFKSNVRFKFQSTSAAGNNLYIDNINIGGVYIGIHDPESPVSSFDVYPNPAQDRINISITLEKASELSIELFDITGRKITDVANEKLATGIHNFPINQSLQAGIYFVRLTSAGITSSKKVVVLD